MGKGNKGVARKEKHREYLPDLDCWRLELTRGQYALLDKEDIDRLGVLSWSARYRPGRKGYVTEGNPGSVGYSNLARAVMRVTDSSKVVDHINGNGLDNRRCNLRVCDQNSNTKNARRHSKAASKYKGVTPSRGCPGKPWRAQIQVNKKKKALGNFTTETEAAEAYDNAARKYFGEFACVNFPRDGERGALKESNDA